MKDKYQSEMLRVLHEDMQDMHRSGIISDARMREFDEMCLVQEEPAVYAPQSKALAEPSVSVLN